MRQALAEASDTALSRVVGMLEEAGNPAEAASLLAGVRVRLREIRPPRRMNLVRLLFMPLDGSIVQAQSWQRDGGKVPRSALQALADQLRAAEPAEWEDLALAAQGYAMDDAAAIRRLGGEVWALAARAMPQAPPPGWQAATGIKPEHHAPLVRLCVGVWNQATPLWDAVEMGGTELPLPVLQRTLAPSLGNEAVFAACLATLMRFSTAPWAVASAAGTLGPMPRLVAERALDAYIETMPPVIDAQAPGASAQRAQHFVDVCEALENGLPDGRPERRQRLRHLRHETDRACRAAYAGALEQILMQPLAGLAATAGIADIIAIEHSARQIRGLGLAGRRIGGTGSYDAAERGLPDAMARLLQHGTPAGLSRIDMARLAEILCGPDAAAKLL